MTTAIIYFYTANIYKRIVPCNTQYLYLTNLTQLQLQIKKEFFSNVTVTYY